MKTAVIMGTRPEIIKLAPIIEKIPKKNCEIVFTGQHYDYQMGMKFVDQLPKTATGKVQRFKLRTSQDI